MPFDSNGTFNRARIWVSDAAANIKIRADYHDAHDGDLASGLSTCITKDGRTQPTANLPMNGKKIVNAGETLASDPPGTLATKGYVDNFKAFATGLTVTGANYPNGMIHFAATTGVTGLSWVNADMSWVGKVAETGKWRQRLAVTNDAQGAGTELITIDKGGFLGNNSGWYTHNLSHDGTNWRTNALGTGTAISMANGVLTFQSNDTATVQANQIATLNTFVTLSQGGITHDNTGTAGGNSALSLKKKGTGFTNQILGYGGTTLRWQMQMGAGDAESSTRVGSSFYLHSYDNTGANAYAEMTINRSTHAVTFGGDVNTTGDAFSSTTTVAILAAASGGAVYLRPNGQASGTEQCYVSNVGDWHIAGGHLHVDANTTRGSYLGMGQMGRNGYSGNYTGFWHNWVWANGYVYALVNTTNVGAIQMVCDYRTKRNVKPLPSMWDKVKALKPISYNPKKFGDLFEDSDEERWGFTAHELQGTLTHAAANGRKDEVDVIQSPNLMVIVAALTKALQEAMTRIEALEARQA